MAKIKVTPVTLALRAANQSANSMVAKCREAAKLAAQETTSGTIGERYNEIGKIYAETLKACDINVRSVFRAALLCALAPTEQIETAKPTEETDAVFTPAGEIKTKKGMIEAAADLRETFKMATSGKKGSVKTSAPVIESSDGFADWVAKLQLYVKDAEHAAVIKQHLEQAGYTMNKAKASKTVTATGKSMADLGALLDKGKQPEAAAA